MHVCHVCVAPPAAQAATRYNSGLPLYARSQDTFQIIYGHNFYDMGSPAGFPCTVKQVAGKWTYCGGYQVVMHFPTMM